MTYLLRRFSVDFVDQTDEIMRTAYRTSYGRRSDLNRYLNLPDSCPLVAIDGSTVLGFGAALDYGSFAYIGLMAVDRKSQHRGIGGAILRSLVDWLNGRNCPTILLDASPFGEPLYAKNGFLGLEQTRVLQRVRNQNIEKKPDDSITLYSPKDLPDIVSFDEPFFGAERAGLLRSFFDEYPSRSYVSRDEEGKINGFLVAQARSIGPWVVCDSRSGENLLLAGLSCAFEDRPSVIVSSLNTECLQLLTRYGFDVNRSNRHMRMGREIVRGRSTAIFGQATMGFG